MIRPLLTLLAVVASLVAGPAPALSQGNHVKITISGSDTMNLLTQRLAEFHMQGHPDVDISVRGGGSTVGIGDLMDGIVDIAQTSRTMTPEEIEEAKANGHNPQEHIVALDGIAVAVNRESPVRQLTLAQIRAIYTGAVTRWSQLNPAWPDSTIKVYARESSSGTSQHFKEEVLDDLDFGPATGYLAATSAVAGAVRDDRDAIGFGGVAYFVRTGGVRVVALKRRPQSPAVSLVTDDGKHVRPQVIQSGDYPISRPLYFYTRETASGEIRKFLDWVGSAEGQRIVGEMEYIPLGTSEDQDGA